MKYEGATNPRQIQRLCWTKRSALLTQHVLPFPSEIVQTGKVRFNIFFNGRLHFSRVEWDSMVVSNPVNRICPPLALKPRRLDRKKSVQLNWCIAADAAKPRGTRLLAES